MTCQPDHLIIFLKAPWPGRVKTRLAQAIGAEAACAAYCRLVDILLGTLSALPEVELRFTPDDASAEIERWREPSWIANPQGEGDLGQRLERAFAEAFASGAKRVVVIGSDCPTVTLEVIRAAWAGLRHHDLVLGPARDGGYWLVGLNKPQPALFSGISWSSATVLQETLLRAQKSSLNTKMLLELEDVDTEADWLCFLSGAGA